MSQLRFHIAKYLCKTAYFFLLQVCSSEFLTSTKADPKKIVSENVFCEYSEFEQNSQVNFYNEVSHAFKVTGSPSRIC